MAKIKHTKNELKAQKEALARFERFLPMLQLKKQQLQLELQGVAARMADAERKDSEIRGALRPWVRLLSEPLESDGIEGLVSLERVDVEDGNIAGVTIPVFKDAALRRGQPDLFSSPTWTDDAAGTLGLLIENRVERDILAEQRRLIAEELRITAQRVNLFEKVKIPDCRENIRVIKIFLGDEQTAAVARGKIAKKRTQAGRNQPVGSAP
ncbi:V-type ATP synthase subunit D [Verrucomicrobiota bacterium]